MIELNDLYSEYDHKLKYILIGPQNSGKTAFFNKLIYNDFTLIKENNIGVEIG